MLSVDASQKVEVPEKEGLQALPGQFRCLSSLAMQRGMTTMRGLVLKPFSPPHTQEFILGCLLLNPDRRPTAHNLLFHRVLFEVHSLKLLAAHSFLNNQGA